MYKTTKICFQLLLAILAFDIVFVCLIVSLMEKLEFHTSIWAD